MVTVASVSKVFTREEIQIEALRDINLNIDAGEIVSVVGPSGCGKTTLLRIIAGLIQPSKGHIHIQRTQRESRKHNDIGFVFQKPLMFPWRTVLQNVMLPVEIKQPKTYTAFVDVAKEHLASLGLKKFEHAYPSELSGGMMQRVALARALILRPRLLLLDEPFSALDEITREQIWMDFIILSRKHNLSVMLVTHNVREAVILGDRVLIMSQRPGRIFRDMPSPFHAEQLKDVNSFMEFNKLCELIRSELY